MNLTDKIWAARNNSVASSRMHKEPDFIMLHPVNKSDLYKSLKGFSGFTINNGEIIMIYGIKIIWTISIEEDDIICTYK